MTKEEYNEKYNSISEQIRFLEQAKKVIDETYLKEHCKFDDGDKVKITYPDGQVTKGFVYDAKCIFGDINYWFLKVKTDGTPSVNKLYLWNCPNQRDLKLELIEKWPAETA